MPLPRTMTGRTDQIDRAARFATLQAECREIVLKWSSTDAIAAGRRTGMPTTAAWIGLGVSAVVARPMVRVHNAYAVRDALQSAGYHFDGIDRVWVREFATVADCVTEAARLSGAHGIQMGDGQAV